MAYTKQTWADLPSKTTPINAERLTHIEDGIYNAAATADTAASTAGTAAANVGIVSGKVETLTERVNGLDTAVSNKVDKVAGKGLSTNDYDDTDKGKVDSLGTASTKNSTSVVTESSDLVESGAVYDALGFGNKNLLNQSEIVLGSISGQSGEDTSSDRRLRTPFIKVTPLDTYALSCNNDSFWVFEIHEYSSSKTWLRFFTKNTNTAIYQPSSDAYYIKVLYKKSDNSVCYPYELTQPQIEKGSVVTAYEPYHASVEEYCASKQNVVDTVGWCSTVLDKGVIASANVNGDGTINISTFSVAYFKVEANKKYTVSNCNDFTDRNLVFGYYVDVPVINAVSYNNSRTVIERGTATSQTVTAPIDGYIVIRMNNSADNIRFEVGEVVTQSVEDKKCDNTVIAPVENGSTASQAYAVGEHFIRDGQFKEVTQPIASGGAINSSNTTDKPIADLFTKQKITGIAVDGTILKEIVSNNSYVIPAYKLAVINLAVKVGTYAAWTICLTGLPKPNNNLSAVIANRGRSTAMLASIYTQGNMQLTNLTGSDPVEDNEIVMSITYNYDSL